MYPSIIYKKPWAFLTGGSLVFLEDFDGEVSLRVAYTSPFGQMTASRLFGRKVTLLANGTTTGVSWVENWKYYSEPKKKD